MRPEVQETSALNHSNDVNSVALMDFRLAGGVSLRNQKPNLNDMENRLKDIPDKYLLIIAHYLAGYINDTETLNRFNGPLLKASIRSVYWIFLIQYAILAILGILMNLLIIIYILYHRLFKDASQAFIVNLALCHLVQCSIVLPITLMVMLIQNWIFGKFLCYFLPMLQDIPLYVSMMTHILIAWDRMRWLGDPLRGRFPTFVCCCATWLTGMIIALPYPIYTMYLEIGNFLPGLQDMGLCVVNLMDDMHEYMRGLFFLMYCGPTILLAYLYIRTSKELRSSNLPIEMITQEYLTANKKQLRHSSTSVSGGLNNTMDDRRCSGATTATITATSDVSSGRPATVNSCRAATMRSYDLCHSELDVCRERRNQRSFGSMAAAQIACLCPLMVLRFARFSMDETYENQKHFDFTYLMFVWIAFLPTLIFPCIYATQILPRTEQKRLRGYFRLSIKRSHSKPSSQNTNCETPTDAQQRNAISQSMNTSSIFSGPDYESYLSSTNISVMSTERQEFKAKSSSDYKGHHQLYTNETLERKQVNSNYSHTSKDGQIAKDSKTVTSMYKVKGSNKFSKSSNLQRSLMQSPKGENANYSPNTGDSIIHSKYNGESLDNHSSIVTASTYCNGNSSLTDEGDISTFGDMENSSIVSGRMTPYNHNDSEATLPAYYDKKSSIISGHNLRKSGSSTISYGDCSTYYYRDAANYLGYDVPKYETTTTDQPAVDNQRYERRRLPNLERMCQSYDQTSPATSTTTISAKQVTASDPLTFNSTTLSNDEMEMDSLKTLPSDLTTDCATNANDINTSMKFKYSRYLGRKSSTYRNHSGSSSTNYRQSKRDIYKSLHCNDLIAGAFGELDPTQPLSKMSLIENRLLAHRSSSGIGGLDDNNCSGGGGGGICGGRMSTRSSMKSHDNDRNSMYSTQPELDFRENIFAEL